MPYAFWNEEIVHVSFNMTGNAYVRENVFHLLPLPVDSKVMLKDSGITSELFFHKDIRHHNDKIL